MTPAKAKTGAPIRLHSAAGRWIVAASVLGSGAAFLEGSVVNVALPAIARDFGLGMAGLQWVLNGYLLTLSALMLLGGALGDRFPRSRIFALGSLGFAAASIGCALAPNLVALVALRLSQGVAGALLVPNSLAMLETAFPEGERGEAIGQWAAWSAFSTSLGPLLGGWLVDAVSWRWVFAAIVPFSVAAAWIVRRHAAKQPAAAGAVDYFGAALATVGLAGAVWALISGPALGFGHPAVLATGLGGATLLAGFVLAEWRIERMGRRPLLPLGVFRSRQFTGANLTTLLVYIALNGLFFLLMPQLQLTMGYRALTAGAALLPVNLLMLVLSPIAGRVATRTGPRLPIALGSLIAGGAMLLFARIGPGASYLSHVLPAALVFGVGLAVLVAPLTRAVLAAAGQRDAGMASAINSAVARFAGLLAAAALPLAAGLGGLHELEGPAFAAGYVRAMLICAGLCAAGALIALVTVGGKGRETSS
ncbi:MAG TPA: MFS transporter [Gemmatimonadales bacterium]|nr:MFS transporter [Gemmatimonadales bacterium]